MSSAINHRKRSRYSYQTQGSAFRAHDRGALYRTVNDRNNRGLLGKLASMFHRRAPHQAPSKETVVHQEG